MTSVAFMPFSLSSMKGVMRAHGYVVRFIGEGAGVSVFGALYTC